VMEEDDDDDDNNDGNQVQVATEERESLRERKQRAG